MSNTGCRIYTKINRPDKKLIELFKGIPVANIADNMGRIACVDKGLVPFNKTRLLGTAFTVKAPQGDNLMFHKALDMAAPGDILVIAGFGCEDRAQCGEIMIKYAISKGIGGFVIDGAVRDAEYIADESEFPVYARSVQPNGPYKNGPGEINVPVAAGGIVIFPGDILVGDADGLVVIRPQEAEELAAKTRRTMDIEQKAFNDIAAGIYDRKWVDNNLANIKCEIIDTTWDGK